MQIDSSASALRQCCRQMSSIHCRRRRRVVSCRPILYGAERGGGRLFITRRTEQLPLSRHRAATWFVLHQPVYQDADNGVTSNNAQPLKPAYRVSEWTTISFPKRIIYPILFVFIKTCGVTMVRNDFTASLSFSSNPQTLRFRVVSFTWCYNHCILHIHSQNKFY